eukprot:CAMPEP_0115857418 /NCGR_PEP_ID=MMETSP0287-20121206/15564_1 /TAXON_ID=412157 /ORGANISM="Chrysochromulina rotalis, Strain UIO044" /LENGTH=224 /DNA_ID=CAMNT_0003311635 /DNA_START=183 /DNA_END=855 /DNA_ORIENTATION=+
MRHSIRLDMDGHSNISDHQWPDRKQRPYDTPIKDYELPRRAAEQLKASGLPTFDVIICSPYRRCLQTAAIVAKELNVRRMVIDNRLGEDLLDADRCWAEADMSVGEYTYMSSEEAARWASSDEGGHGAKHIEFSWQRDAHPVLSHPDSVRERLLCMPQIVSMRWGGNKVVRSAATVLVVTHGGLVNAFAPSFDWAPDVGRYRADECGWMACRGFEPLDGYTGDT